eukprot:SM000008S22289  [mRNA]  locus=s8:807720:809396:- [translate_table: standard]
MSRCIGITVGGLASSSSHIFGDCHFEKYKSTDLFSFSVNGSLALDALLVAARASIDLDASAGTGLPSGTLVASRSEASLSLGASSVEASAPKKGKQHMSGLLKQRAGSDMPIPYTR